MHKVNFGFEIETDRFDVLDLMKLLLFANKGVTDKVVFDVYGFKLNFDYADIVVARKQLLDQLKDVEIAEIGRLRLSLRKIWK